MSGDTFDCPETGYPQTLCPLTSCKWHCTQAEGRCLAHERRSLPDQALTIEEVAAYRRQEVSVVKQQEEEARSRIQRLVVFAALWVWARQRPRAFRKGGALYLRWLGSLPTIDLFQGPPATSCLHPKTWEEFAETNETHGLKHNQVLNLGPTELRELVRELWPKL